MAYLCEWRFEPLPGRRDELDERVNSLADSLWRNGQVVPEDYVVAPDDHGIRLTCTLPRRTALAARFWSCYARRDYAAVRECCRGIHEPRVGRSATYAEHAGSLRGVTGLVLQPVFGVSPIVAENTGRRVALYALPLDVDARDALMRWARAHGCLHRLFMYSGALEVESYRQLADPASRHAREGREFAKAIEGATGLPCAYFLVKHWGTADAPRRCPGCGGPFGQPTGERSARPDPRGERVCWCDACRLVSEASCAFDDRRLARIGEWRDGPRGP